MTVFQGYHFCVPAGPKAAEMLRLELVPRPLARGGLRLALAGVSRGASSGCVAVGLELGARPSGCGEAER